MISTTAFLYMIGLLIKFWNLVICFFLIKEKNQLKKKIYIAPFPLLLDIENLNIFAMTEKVNLPLTKLTIK